MNYQDFMNKKDESDELTAVSSDSDPAVSSNSVDPAVSSNSVDPAVSSNSVDSAVSSDSVDPTVCANAEKDGEIEKEASNLKKRRKPLKKSTMIAVGASITAVLLAAIITIVIIAVEISSIMTTVYFTNFGKVDSIVRNDIFIGSVNGEYSLYEGDKIIGEKYSSLEWNDSLNGYIYTKIDGTSGALAFNGSNIFRVNINSPEYNIVNAKFFTPQSATYFIKDNYHTIDFDTKKVNAALDGLTPLPINQASAVEGKFFITGNKGYITLSVTKDTNQTYAISGALLGTEATFSISGQSSADVKVIAIYGDSAIVQLADTAVYFTKGQSQTVGDYYSVNIDKTRRNELVVLHIVGNNIYYQNLTNTNLLSNGERIYSRLGLVQIQNNIYKLEDGKLTLKHENAKVVKSKKDTDYYYISGNKLFSSADKLIYSATSSEKLIYLGSDIVLDGSVAKTIDGKKTVTDVKSYSFVMADEVIFTTSNGELKTINDTVFNASALEKLGAVATTKKGIFSVSGGYLVVAEKGVYISSSDTVMLYSEYPGGIEIIDKEDGKNLLAAVAVNKIQIFNLMKGKTELSEQYFYNNAQITQSNKFGIVYRVNGLYGAIDINGKIVAPQYDDLLLQKDYMVVSQNTFLNGTAIAIASKSGKLLTGYDYSHATTFGEYILVFNKNAQLSLINASGKKLYTDISDFKYMKSLKYSKGGWTKVTDHGYSVFLSSKGYKVMRYNLDV